MIVSKLRSLDDMAKYLYDQPYSALRERQKSEVRRELRINDKGGI